MKVCRIRQHAFYLLLILLLVCAVVIYQVTKLALVNTREDLPDERKTEDVRPLHTEKDGTYYLPEKVNLPLLSHFELAALYHRYISELQVNCDKIIRLGEEADGGWDLCDDRQYRPGSNCLVYSFGIDNDFSFDDAIAQKYGCEVHSFDPSMKMKESMRKPNVWFHPYAIGYETQILRGNKWEMFTLSDIAKKLHQQTKSITVLKLDVEEWEMITFPQMISDGSLKHLKQLLVEFHITTRPEPNKQRYIQGLSILIDLYKLGFRIFWTKRNLFCRFTSREGDIERTGCHEVSFVNINVEKHDV